MGMDKPTSLLVLPGVYRRYLPNIIANVEIITGVFVLERMGRGHGWFAVLSCPRVILRGEFAFQPIRIRFVFLKQIGSHLLNCL